MRAIIVFSLFVVSAFLFGAVMAYPLKLTLDPFLDLAFRKYLTYATLLSGLLISGVYLKTYNLLSIKAFGFNQKPNAFFRSLVNGFVYGVVIILIIELLMLILGIHEFDTSRSFTLSNISLLFLKAIIVGLLIGTIEEAIFRGALFSGLYKQTGAVITVFFSSLVYSTVHFIRYREVAPDTDIGWLTGFSMMPEAFRRFYEWSIVDYFLTLFIFGVLLGLFRLKHQSIAACIGLHAGVVMLIKISNYITNRTHDSNYEYLSSPYNATFGWMSFTVILVFTIFYLIKLKK